MTYKDQFQNLRQKIAETYNAWLMAQNRLVNQEDGFTEAKLWDELDDRASDLQKAQNEFNKFCMIVRKGSYSRDDAFGEQQACA